MGRCYEFGVSIEPGSDQAMIVAPEGGYCLSPDTGVTCHGRFAGCEDVISQPGRIPPSAPAVSVPQANAVPPVLPGTAGPGEAGDSDSTAATALVDIRDERPRPRPADTGPDIAALLEEVQGQLAASGAGTDARIGRLEQGLDDLALAVSTTSVPDSEVIGYLGQLTDHVRELSSDYRELLATLGRRHEEVQGAISEIVQAAQAIRRDIGDLAASHRRDIAALRRDFIEAATPVEVSGPPIETVVREELRSVRRALDALADRSPSNVVTASQLAETINAMRGASLEQISAAHLVQSIHDEVRALVESPVTSSAQHYDETMPSIVRSYP